MKRHVLVRLMFIILISAHTCLFATPGTLKWMAPIHGTGQQVAAGADGTVYALTVRDVLWALTPDGKFKWNIGTIVNYNATNFVVNSYGPAIEAGGSLYLFRAADGFSTAFNVRPGPKVEIVAGTPFAVPGSTDISLPIYYYTPTDGQRAVSTTYNLQGKSSDGTLWPGSLYNYCDFPNPSQAASSGTNIYGVINCAYKLDNTPIGAVAVFSPSDNSARQIAFPGVVLSGIAVTTNNQAVFGTNYGNLYFVDSTPSTVKRMTLGGDLSSAAPSVGSDGVIYIGSRQGNLYAINPDLTVRWTAPINEPLLSSPSTSPDGKEIYLTTATGLLMAFNADNGRPLWAYGGILGTVSPQVSFDGSTVYAATSDQQVAAINTK